MNLNPAICRVGDSLGVHTSEQMLAAINSDQSASYLLVRMLYEAKKRDPVDAMRDAELLLVYCAKRVREAQA